MVEKFKITIEEFKNLIPSNSPDRKSPYGAFAIERSHTKQCENLEIGDTVFYLVLSPKLDDPDCVTEGTIVQAEVIA